MMIDENNDDLSGSANCADHPQALDYFSLSISRASYKFHERPAFSRKFKSFQPEFR
jgi:hypothetical protein